MRVAILAGALRRAEVLSDWTDRLPGSCIFELPGQGGWGYFENPTVESYVNHFADIIPKGTLVAGESLGGLVAIGLASQGYNAIAFDPPMTTSKLWPQQYFIKSHMARDPENQYLRDFAKNIFGINPDGTIDEKIYYDLILRNTSNIEILTGNYPLFPPYGPPGGQCVFDDVDAYVSRLNPNCRVTRIDGPHDLLTSRIEESLNFILQSL